MIYISLFKKHHHKSNKKLLNKYPCDSYLHNSLKFIAEGKVDEAYTEICFAIMKSGGQLSKEEDIKFNDIIKQMY